MQICLYIHSHQQLIPIVKIQRCKDVHTSKCVTLEEVQKVQEYSCVHVRPIQLIPVSQGQVCSYFYMCHVQLVPGAGCKYVCTSIVTRIRGENMFMLPNVSHVNKAGGEVQGCKYVSTSIVTSSQSQFRRCRGASMFILPNVSHLIGPC